MFRRVGWWWWLPICWLDDDWEWFCWLKLTIGIVDDWRPGWPGWYDLCFDEWTVEQQDFVDWIWQSELLMIATQDRVAPWFLDVGSDNDIWDWSLRPPFQNPLFFSLYTGRQLKDWCGNIIAKFHEGGEELQISVATFSSPNNMNMKFGKVARYVFTILQFK